jgi:4-hydroxy-4-methyl-2-oxoglutarate aldolase
VNVPLGAPQREEGLKAETPFLFAHRPLIPPRINGSVPRVAPEVMSRYETAYVPDLSDAVGSLYTMTPDMKSLYEPSPRVVGQALTVKAPPGDNLTIHGALALAGPGDVLVVDWRGFVGGCGSGAGSLIVPMRKGLRGVIIDGGWRDIGELKALRFPVYGKAVSALSPPKDRPGEINVPVSCGGVVVEPGDIVVGDEEGIVVVPSRWAKHVAQSLREYSPHTHLEDWDTVEWDTRLAQRREYFDRLVEEFASHARQR